MKKWELSQPDEKAVSEISQYFGLNEIASRILVNRGFTTREAVEAFLFINESHQHNPFLFNDMEKAVETLLEARSRNELVLIHGDYDVDGITSTVILKEFLEENGWRVDVYIPHRIEEGYGIQLENILTFKENNVSCLVTVDCGITALDSVALAKKFGMKVIITDHHEVNGDLPPADAIVNPKVPGENYPFRDLAGVGVTYKLVQAISEAINYPHPERFLELVALGTVADMVSLLDENRYFVKKGIELLSNTKRVGLKRLLERLGLKNLTSHDISYKIAPRLNAAGRMGSANDAFNLLIMNDPAKADGVVDRLMELNSIRRKTEWAIYKEAIEIIETNDLWKDPVIVVAKENWHVGVIGIVAAKLANRYEKPVAVVSLDEKIAKGSIRSYNGYDIMNIFNEDILKIFEEIGGHSSAVGFSLKRDQLESFREYIRNISLEGREEKVIVDAEVRMEDIDDRFIEDIKKLMPFGQGNPEPVLLFKDVLIEKIHFFGEDGSNVFLHLKNGEKNLEVVGYNFKNLSSSLSTLPVTPTRGDVVVNLRPMGNGISYYLVSLDVKPILSVKNREVSHILSRPKEEKTLIKVPYPSKTKLLLSIKEELQGKLAIVSLTNATTQNILGCLSRYYTSKNLGFVNSTFSKEEESDIVLFTLAGFLKKHRLDDFEVFVVNEFQDFLAHRDSELVKNFLDIVDKHPGKFIFVASIEHPELEEFLKKEKYDVVELRTDEPEKFLFSDQRNSFDLGSLVDAHSFAVVVSEKKLIPDLYRKIGKDAVVYYTSMDVEKKIKAISLMESGSARKAIITSNTDGLPTHIKGDIFFYDFPLSIYEIVDLLRRKSVVNLCYSSSDIEKRRYELNKLFPDREKLKEIAITATNLKDKEKLEKILESEYDLSSATLRKIYLDLLEESGFNFDRWSFSEDERIPWRLLERELEIAQFERTVSVLSKDLKWIFNFFKDTVVK